MKHFPIHRTRLFVVLTGAFLLALLVVGPSAIARIQPDTFDCSTQTEVPQVECEALVALYNSTSGDNWANNDGWLVTNTPCSWHGVTCSSEHVTEIDLYANNLSGSFPSELGNLSNLTRLHLDSNQLSGSIPLTFVSLGSLRWFFFNNTNLCEPEDASFQSWLAGVEDVRSTGVICSE